MFLLFAVFQKHFVVSELAEDSAKGYTIPKPYTPTATGWKLFFPARRPYGLYSDDCGK